METANVIIYCRPGVIVSDGQIPIESNLKAKSQIIKSREPDLKSQQYQIRSICFDFRLVDISKFNFTKQLVKHKILPVLCE